MTVHDEMEEEQYEAYEAAGEALEAEAATAQAEAESERLEEVRIDLRRILRPYPDGIVMLLADEVEEVVWELERYMTAKGK